MVPISVVIPTRNVEATIEACLTSIMTAIPVDLRQIVVVDNGSTDRTLDIVRRFSVQLEAVSARYVSSSRNHGARLARHPLIAFVDADCTVRPGWYEAVQEALADPTVGAAGARYELRDHPSWVETAWEKAHRRPNVGERQNAFYIPAGNFATWQKIFRDVKGFDETLETGEDPDLCIRIAALGLHIVESRAIQCVHLGEPRTLRAVFRRQQWHGRGARFRYSDGRLAPITFATFLFGGTVVAGVIGTAAAVLTAQWTAIAVLLGVLIVPTAYAVRYARRPLASHLPQLLAIYLAYFLGRATALPVVIRRFVRRAAARGIPGEEKSALLR
jgi:glycosyltransferase involved in cell wall biosynthesis